MKKLLSLALVLVLMFSLTAVSFAITPKDLVFDRDATLSASFIVYGNITVKSGVTLTIDKNSGFEIAGNITVEPGAKIICNGVGAGDFNFSMKNKSSVVSGMDLYYIRDLGGNRKIYKVAGGYSAIAALDCWDWEGGWHPSFKWNAEVNGWCLTMALNNDLTDGAAIYHSERDMENAEKMADSLNALGLFKGTNNGYELDRKGTRAEALVMLIRLLGKEQEALSGEWSHPFTDVPKWADKYIGYAYENGLTTGVSATKFGTGNATAQQYLTFVLRALGYTDDEERNIYEDAFGLAEYAGIYLPESETYIIDRSNFWRSDMVVASYRALGAETVSGGRLYEKLIADGVFTMEDYSSAM